MELQKNLQIFPYFIWLFYRPKTKIGKRKQNLGKKGIFRPPDKTGPNPAQPASHPAPQRPMRRVVRRRPKQASSLARPVFPFLYSLTGGTHMSSLSLVRSFQEICTRMRVSVPIQSNQKHQISLPLFYETSPINSPRPLYLSPTKP
jgi:hypothetical protein